MNSETTHWYYVIDKERKGPTSEPDIRKLIQSKTLTADTLVWTAGMSSWVALSSTKLADELKHIGNTAWYYVIGSDRNGPVDETEIKRLLKQGSIDGNTSIWKSGMATWTPLRSTSFANDLSIQLEPPPLEPTRIDNSPIWVLAFMPLGFIILTPLVKAILPQDWNTSGATDWLVPIVTNIILVAMDDYRVRKAGYSLGSVAWFGFLFFVPIYMFIRASRLRQAPWYAIVWIVTFIISLAIESTQRIGS